MPLLQLSLSARYLPRDKGPLGIQAVLGLCSLVGSPMCQKGWDAFDSNKYEVVDAGIEKGRWASLGPWEVREPCTVAPDIQRPPRRS